MVPKGTIYSRKLGFSSSSVDSSMFCFRRRDGNIIILLIYVDDIVLTTNSASLIQSLIHYRNHNFALIDLGSLSYVLGMEPHRIGNTLFLSQSQYLSNLLVHTKMHNVVVIILYTLIASAQYHKTSNIMITQVSTHKN